jgi:hypothetical protein
MTLRSFFYGLAAVVVALLSVAVVGFWGLTSHSSLSTLREGGKPDPGAAIFVSKQAPVMVSLLINPHQLETLRMTLIDPDQRRQARAELAEFKRNLLAKQGLNYEQDVEPWIGDEVTAAITTTDVDRDANNGRQPGYLLAIATRDPQRSREFLQLFWQKQAVAGTDLSFEQYSGVKIIYGHPAASPLDLSTSDRSTSTTPDLATDQVSLPLMPTLATAVVGDRFVLFANHPKVLRDAIHNVQASDLNLHTNYAYQQALQALPERQVGALFVNLPQLGDWVAERTALESSIPDNTEARLYNSMMISLDIKRQGLLADVALVMSAGKKLPEEKPTVVEPVKALEFIPPTSFIAAAGTDLNRLWQQLTLTLTGYDTLLGLLQQSLVPLQDQWGIPLADQVFPQITGEYALGLLPKVGVEQPDWVFVTRRSPATDTLIEQFNQIAYRRGLSVGPLILGEQQIFAWTKLSTANLKRGQNKLALQANVEAAHTTVGDYELLATSIEAIEQALQKNKSSLLQSVPFKQAIAQLNEDNDGYFYVDWQAVHGLLEQQWPLVRLAELTVKPLFEHLHSLAISSYGNEATLRRGAIFIQLQESK